MVLLMMMSLFQSGFAIEPALTRVVNITNDLGSGIGLIIHCKSADNDLGKHEVPFQSHFSWSFKSNPLFQNTEFYCYMWWENVSGSFDVYKAVRDDERCASKCWWSIRTIGAFSYNENLDRWDLMYICNQWQYFLLLQLHVPTCAFFFCICTYSQTPNPYVDDVCVFVSLRYTKAHTHQNPNYLPLNQTP
ncbi:PREDICTED: self-incompatibility [Prunus dulcis]|uniref:S-protein homolog n=1 Tax=Prunus dulcis TaxID=3755 RepID=A0A5E4GB60_PRUDU|nr:PREDICTED: self-incompatibility [Prunus dulcis]